MPPSSYTAPADISDQIMALLESNRMVLIWPAPDGQMRVQINKLCCHQMLAEGTADDLPTALAIAIERIRP